MLIVPKAEKTLFYTPSGHFMNCAKLRENDDPVGSFMELDILLGFQGNCCYKLQLAKNYYPSLLLPEPTRISEAKGILDRQV